MTALRAAIYARKSTDEGERHGDLKSVPVQIASARRFAEDQGFRVLEEHIYPDDGVSGVRISRPKLDLLMTALGIKDGIRRSSTPLPFDVLIVRDQSRLIRNSDHDKRLIKRILRSGVQLWYYNERRRVEGGLSGEMLTSVTGIADSHQRERARETSREGLTERALKGYNTGGCCYGYINKPVMGTMPSGQETRLYTDFVIHDEQADVIRRIFKMYAAGYGTRSIAKALNGDPSYAALSRRFFDGERPPKPIIGKRGTGSWAPTAVRGMLRNERYAGVLTYGRKRNDYDEEGVKYRARQDDLRKIVRTERSDLRIVPSELWDAVQKRHSAERRSYLHSTNGLVHGRPEKGRESRYLLSGLIQCGGCGSSMVVSSQPHGSGAKRKLVRCYVCNYRSHRGSTACANSLRPREELITQEVLAGIGTVLTPDVLTAAIRKALQKHRQQAKASEGSPERQRRALAKLEAERDRLVAAIRMGGGRLESLVAPLTACEEQIAAVRAELTAAERPTSLDEVGERRFERTLLDLAGRWQEWIGKHPTLARQALRAMLVGPIKLLPEADGYRLKGVSRLGALFEQGAAANRAQVASRRGFEPRLPP